MFIFGHLGIGNALLGPWKKGLPRRYILLGCVLPDIIDKPLYYGLEFATGKHGAQLGLISGTRTFGHTALMLLILSAIAMARRSRAMLALCAGFGTHLFLDSIGEVIMHGNLKPDRVALLWPFATRTFPIIPFRDIHEHMQTFGAPFLIAAEVIGVLLLAWDFWKTRHESELLDFFRRRRQERHRLEHERKQRATSEKPSPSYPATPPG